MGDILTIRVMAQTGSEEEVAETWPALCSLVWPDWMRGRKIRVAGLDELLSPVFGPSQVEKLMGARKHGVVELASDLADLVQFGGLPEDISDTLRVQAENVGAANRKLSRELSDWDTRGANASTDRLEDALNAAEKELDKLLKKRAAGSVGAR